MRLLFSLLLIVIVLLIAVTMTIAAAITPHDTDVGSIAHAYPGRAHVDATPVIMRLCENKALVRTDPTRTCDGAGKTTTADALHREPYNGKGRADDALGVKLNVNQSLLGLMNLNYKVTRSERSPARMVLLA